MKVIKIFPTTPESCDAINEYLKNNPIDPHVLPTITPENLVIVTETDKSTLDQITMFDSQRTTCLTNRNNAILRLKITQDNLDDIRSAKVDISQEPGGITEALNKLIEQKNEAISVIRVNDKTISLIEEILATLNSGNKLEPITLDEEALISTEVPVTVIPAIEE